MGVGVGVLGWEVTDTVGVYTKYGRVWEGEERVLGMCVCVCVGGGG